MSTGPVRALLESGASRAAADIDAGELGGAASELLAAGFRVALVAAHDGHGPLRVVYLFTAGRPDRRIELHLLVDRDYRAVPSLASLSFSASRFEREIRDLFGIEPLGHPMPRRLVLHQHWPEGWHPMRSDAGPMPPMVEDADPFPFVEVEGSGVYEIPVGPVHAGLIEPGHFRFSVVGETIVKMKARLWFVHKGIERLFEGSDLRSAVALAERISGDTAVGHSLAFCMAVEEAWGVRVPTEVADLRGVLLELERLYNHVADVGALCNDVGFGLANARALTLREQLLRLNAQVTGHRLLRGGIVPGGAHLLRLPTGTELAEVKERFHELVDLARANSVVMDRFAGTAVLATAAASEIGVLGVVARSSGLDIDARVDHPFVVPPPGFKPVTRTGGDVLARFDVRVGEVDMSLDWLTAAVEGQRSLVAGSPISPDERSAGHDVAHGSGIVEGWRGSIVHRVEVDDGGILRRVKIVDPSFLTWPALSVSLADTIVPDFPLANKSFNLSYAGNDL